LNDTYIVKKSGIILAPPLAFGNLRSAPHSKCLKLFFVFAKAKSVANRCENNLGNFKRRAKIRKC
jgi:hypothetical protein